MGTTFQPERDVVSRIYYLNLDRRTDRRQRMESLFHEFRMPASRIRAVDGRELPKVHPSCLATESATTRGQKVMWDMVVRQQAPCALFEDDVIFCTRFSEYWRTKTLRIPMNLDALMLGISWPNVEASPDFPDLHRIRACFGMFAYILFPSGARKLLAEEAKNPDYICDHYLRALITRGEFAAMIPHPSWCVAQCGDSDISRRTVSAKRRFGDLFEGAP